MCVIRCDRQPCPAWSLGDARCYMCDQKCDEMHRSASSSAPMSRSLLSVLGCQGSCSKVRCNFVLFSNYSGKLLVFVRFWSSPTALPPSGRTSAPASSPSWASTTGDRSTRTTPRRSSSSTPSPGRSGWWGRTSGSRTRAFR